MEIQQEGGVGVSHPMKMCSWKQKEKGAGVCFSLTFIALWRNFELMLIFVLFFSR